MRNWGEKEKKQTKNLYAWSILYDIFYGEFFNLRLNIVENSDLITKNNKKKKTKTKKKKKKNMGR